MKSTIFFSISSIIYILLLLIVFFSKKYYKTLENKIYSLLIITSFFGLVIELLGVFILNNTNEVLSFIQMKLYQIYLLTWIGLFTLYTIASTKRNNKENKVSPIVILFYIISVIIIFILPTKLYNNNNSVYTYGASINYLYFYSLGCIIIIVYKLLSNIRKMFYKKYLPMSIFLLLGVITMIIQSKNPSLLLMSSTEAFITFLMYFTIENPDIKLMEELEYSKRVAEKSKSETINTLNNIKNELDEPLNQIVNFNDKKIITSTKEELIKEVKNLRIFTTSFADRVFSLIELGKVNSGDYMLNEEMYNTYEMINELEKMLKINNDKVRYNFDVSDDINKVLYGDKNKIKQLLLYINDYILERTKSKTMNIKVSNLSVGNLCRLKFSYFIDLSFEKYLIKDKKEIYIKEEKDDFDYRVILSILKLLDGKINIKKENIISITITIDQKIKSEYDVNNYISSQDNYVNNQIKYTGKKIIIFNDSFEENQKIIELLKKYNLEISLCNNIEKLNKLITENNYDLVLVDDMFSENKAIPREEMLKQCSTKIIQRVNGTRIPVVIMVTKNNKSLEKKYLKYGYVDYIIKPLMDKDVSVILKKYLK